MKTPIITALFLGLLVPSVSFAQVQGDASPITTGNTCVDLQFDLGKGSYGSSVGDLQGYLNDNGYLSVEPTGYFGNMTVTAVKALQNVNGLSPTGYVGPLTRGVIKTATCPVMIGSPAPVLDESVSTSTTSSPVSDYTKYSCSELRELDLFHTNHDLYQQVLLRQQLAGYKALITAPDPSRDQGFKKMAQKGIDRIQSQISSSTQDDYIASCGI